MDMLQDESVNSVQYKFHLYEDRQAHNCTSCRKCESVCLQSLCIYLMSLKKLKNTSACK
ncbi:hypothetical protein [Methanosphaera sp. BMS]|uniref:hypothetical protein n=1 Tax=Methanosphaera sp. BMS TaxID=1789762 RepID=UPI0013A68F15|nr:hypothetical protein [Methanosphaera sp. BMS]